MRSKVINWLMLFLVFALAVNILRTTLDLTRQDNIIQEAKDRLQKVRDESENLKRQLAQTESQQFIEREARNKLNLGKEGEIVLILPSISPFLTSTPTVPDTSANWQRWVRLFL